MCISYVYIIITSSIILDIHIPPAWLKLFPTSASSSATSVDIISSFTVNCLSFAAARSCFVRSCS